MEDSGAYLRVGVTLYKKVDRPLMSGDTVELLVPWNYETLRQDHSKDFISRIEKYDGFCTIPSHTDYRREVGKFLNKYEPTPYAPAPGEFPKITAFLAHIFGDQVEFGLDYLQLLYLKPLQRLPILLLVSRERNTGKTTFLNFLKAIFGGNMTFNTNEDFQSQFNSDWANKLLVGVDEVLLNRREDSERLKNLNTAKSYKIEAKGKDRSEIEFFAKFVLCSNNENNPVIIEPGETRYWVLKIPALEKDNNNLLDEMKKEIPYLLQHLTTRQLTTRQESRLWFRADLYFTPALHRIINHNRGKVENEMLIVVCDILLQLREDTYIFCVSDMAAMLELRQLKAEHSQIRKVLQDNWNLSPAANTVRYTSHRFTYDGDIFSSSRTGRVYTVTKSQIDKMLSDCND